MPFGGTLYAQARARRVRQHSKSEVYDMMRPSDKQWDSYWLNLTPEQQNTEDDEFDRRPHSDLAGTVYARRAAAQSPLAQNHTDYPATADDGSDFDLGVYPEIGPTPQPWAMPDPPEGLPVMPPDGGLPPL